MGQTSSAAAAVSWARVPARSLNRRAWGSVGTKPHPSSLLTMTVGQDAALNSDSCTLRVVQISLIGGDEDRVASPAGSELDGALPLRTGPVMKVSSPMVDPALMRIEVVKDLPSTVGDGALQQIDQLKPAVFVGAADVRAQLLSFGKGLRPLSVVHENLAPRRGKENHRSVRSRGRSPGVGRAATTVAQVADQIGQSAVEKTPLVTRAVRELRAHSLTAFVRERRQIAPRNESARLSELFAYQHS